MGEGWVRHDFLFRRWLFTVTQYHSAVKDIPYSRVAKKWGYLSPIRPIFLKLSRITEK